MVPTLQAAGKAPSDDPGPDGLGSLDGVRPAALMIHTPSGARYTNKTQLQRLHIALLPRSLAPTPNRLPRRHRLRRLRCHLGVCLFVLVMVHSSVAPSGTHHNQESSSHLGPPPALAWWLQSTMFILLSIPILESPGCSAGIRFHIFRNVPWSSGSSGNRGCTLPPLLWIAKWNPQRCPMLSLLRPPQPVAARNVS